MPSEAERLQSAWIQNCCGDTSCEQYRLEAAIKCLFGEKGGTHKHFADKVNEAAAPSPASHDEAVQAIQPIVAHGIDAVNIENETEEGLCRAIIAALAEKGLLR